MIKQQVRKVGNSLVVTIPKADSERLDIHEGDFVSLDVSKLELKPVLNPDIQRIFDEDISNLTGMLNYLRDR